MAMTISVDEEEVARAIRSGELDLQSVLMGALMDEDVLERIARDIEPLGGTRALAGYLRLLADAMDAADAAA